MCQSEECKCVLWSVCYWRHLSIWSSCLETAEGTRQIPDNNVQICCYPVGFGYKVLWSLTSCWHVGFYCRTTQTELHQNRTQTGSYLLMFSVSQSDEADKAQKDILASHSNFKEKILANQDWRFGCKMDHSADGYMTASTGWTQHRLLLVGGLQNHRRPVAPRLFTATKPLLHTSNTWKSRWSVLYHGWLVTGMTRHHV